MKVNVLAVNWQTHQQTLKQIRNQVFIQEQGVPATLEWDGEDEHAQHWLAYINKQPIACARLMSSGQLGRIAVLSAWRNQGIGRQLVQYTLKQINHPNLFIHAQVNTIGFYQPLGFICIGEPFEEAGIKHVQMIRKRR